MRVIGHRGCPAHGPENTIEAVRTAAPHVDMVEIDIQRCATGEIVVFHDTLLDRLTDASGAVPTTSWESLESLTIGESTATIPLFSSFLEAIPPDLPVNAELKHAGMATDVIDVVSNVDTELLFSSFDPHAIAPFSAHDTAYLFHEGSPRDWSDALAVADALGCAAVHPHHSLLDETRIDEAHDRGFAVNTWTVPNSENVDRLRADGVDGVVVDDWLIAER